MDSLEIRFTEQPQRVSATGAQALTQAIDVSGYRVLDLILSVYAQTGTSPTLDVGVYTSMQIDNEDAWGLLGTFTQVTSANQHQLKSLTGVLKYIRYYVTVGGSASPTVTFEIRGYARRTS